MDIPLHLDKLQKGREKRGIVVRVVRKWIVKENNGQGAPMYVAMVFADSKGNSMYAEIPRAVIGLKEYLFQIGTVYLVKKFRVNNVKPYYRPFDGLFMIELTEFTTVELVPNPPATIPQLIYNVSPFSSIVAATGPVYKYTDVVGYLSRYGPLSSFIPKNKEKVTVLREVYLKDLRDEEIKITLWGNHASDFTVDHVYDPKVGNIVVCLVVGCIPRRLYTDHNKVYLSGSPACAYYFNPDIAETAHYYLKFKDNPVYIDCPPVTEVASSSQMQDIPLQQKTIADLDKIDPFDFEDGMYKCTVTITSIPETVAWWYRSCVSCKKKAEQQTDQRYRCPKCLGYDIIPRYILSFAATDVTGEARFFAYDDEARLIIQKDCEAIIGSVPSVNNLPQPLKKIIGQTYTFGIDLTDDSCRGGLSRQYLVKSVLEKPTRQILTSNPPPVQTISSHELHSRSPAPVLAVESSPQIANSGNEASEPASGTETTPPSGIHVDQSLQKNVATSHGQTARKKLFTDAVAPQKARVSDPQQTAPGTTLHKRKDEITDNDPSKRSRLAETKNDAGEDS